MYVFPLFQCDCSNYKVDQIETRESFLVSLDRIVVFLEFSKWSSILRTAGFRLLYKDHELLKKFHSLPKFLTLSKHSRVGCVWFSNYVVNICRIGELVAPRLRVLLNWVETIKTARTIFKCSACKRKSRLYLIQPRIYYFRWFKPFTCHRKSISSQNS